MYPGLLRTVAIWIRLDVPVPEGKQRSQYPEASTKFREMLEAKRPDGCRLYECLCRTRLMLIISLCWRSCRYLRQIYHVFRIVIFSTLLYGVVFFSCLRSIEAAMGESLSIVENEFLYIKAESLQYISQHQLFVAEGNVDITYRQSHLTADRVELYELTGDAIAIGHVYYEEAGETVRAERVELNFDTEAGKILQGSLSLEGDHYLTGREIQKIGEETYLIYNGSYTACSGDSPAWSFRCTRAKVEQGEYLQGWNTVGYVKGIPVMYFPYFIFPIKTERQSGFLVPDFGRSSNNGFRLTNAYFWAIFPNQDVTLTHTYYQDRGHRFDLEYRYLHSEDTDGTLEGTYFPDKESKEIKRGLNWYHRQTLPYDIKTIVNLDLQSDEQFDQEFGTDLNERTQTELESNLSFTKNFSQHTLRLLIDRLDNLREENTSQAKQRFPELQFKSQFPGILGTPLNISQQTILAHLEEEGKRSKEFERLDTSATFTLPITIIDQALTLYPNFNAHATYYTRDATTAADHNLDAKPVHQLYYNSSVGITGPKFNRIFDLGRKYKVQKIKHLIEPTFSFTYNPAVKKVDVPKFDGTDLQSRRRSRSLYYGITQRLLTKQVTAKDWTRFRDEEEDLAPEDLATEVKEVATLSLSQTYNFEADRRKFDDITLKFSTTPFDEYSLTINAAYDVYIRTFYRTSIDVQARLWKDWNIGVRWDRTASLDRDTDDITAIRRFLSMNTQLTLFESLKLSYSGQLNVENGKHIKDSFGLTYNAQCWDVTATYTEQFVNDEVDSFFSILLNLRNLGQLINIEG